MPVQGCGTLEPRRGRDLASWHGGSTADHIPGLPLVTVGHCLLPHLNASIFKSAETFPPRISVA
eukprot:3167719-Amphidinium_carterae.1